MTSKSCYDRKLVWGDGYFNGTIKTRKTIDGKELTPEEFGLQRSHQLRDLYETLSNTELRHAIANKPVALKPKDFAEEEWFLLL